MTQKLSTPVPGPLSDQQTPHQSIVIPHSVSGWCVLALLVVTAAAPLWWAPVETVFHNNWVQVGGAVVLALASLVLGAVEVFMRRDYSVLLILAFFAVVAEVLLLVGILGLMTLGLVQLE